MYFCLSQLLGERQELIVTLALEPWFAAIGVIAGIMTKCMEEVEEI